MPAGCSDISDKGGAFRVKQAEVAPGHWDITLLHVNMHGRALFFKTISVQQDEMRSNFCRVPDNLTLPQAAEKLEKQSAERAVGHLQDEGRSSRTRPPASKVITRSPSVI